MRSSDGNRVSEGAIQNGLKVLAAFSIGMATMFAGALVYSESQQKRDSILAVDLTRAGQSTPSAEHIAAAIQDQSSAENSTRVDGQQHGRATSSDASAQFSTRDSVGRPSERTLPVPSRSLELGSRMRSEAAQNQAPQSPVSVSQTASHSGVITSDGTPQQSGPERKIPEQPQLSRPQQPQYTPQNQDNSAGLTHNPAALLPDIHGQAIRFQPEPKVVTVQPGTSVEVRLAETLSSDRNQIGHTFRATLGSPLVVDGFVVAGTDSNVLGRLVNAREAPLLGGNAQLKLTLTSITTMDGHVVRVDSNNVEREGSHSAIVNAAKMVTGAAVGAVIGAVTGAAEGAGISSAVRNGDRTTGFMATKRTVVLPAGTQLTFNLASPLRLTEQVNR